MKMALLINEKAVRERLGKAIESPDIAVRGYPTAAKALAEFANERYDLIVIDWQVHPGFESGVAVIDQLAAEIPKISGDRRLYYWEVGRSVIDAIRAGESPNHATPMIVIFPDFDQCGVNGNISRDAAEADIAAKQPAEPLFGSSTGSLKEAVARHLATLTEHN